MRERSGVLYGHQRYQGPQSLSGQATAKGTWQHHAGPREASHPRGGQESGRLPLCLPGCSVHLPNRAQECHGNFLPHSIRADTSITPFCPIAKDLPSGGSASSSCPSHIGAQMVPSAQKMAPFPRACGKHTFGWNHFKGNPSRTPQLQVARDPTLEQST